MSVDTRKHAVEPILGTGVGLRHVHLEEIASGRPDVAWYELLTDNHTDACDRELDLLQGIRSHTPMTFHCVGMNLGSTDPLEINYLKEIRRLADMLEPAWISDHICFTGVDGVYYHELLPLPCTEEALLHMAGRISQAQDFFGEQILVENPSAYAAYTHNDMKEWEFVRGLVEEADCGLLLDLNNIYVNSQNFGFDAFDYLDAMPLHRVREIHLAGFDDRGEYLLDSHGARVSEEVWKLFAKTMSLAPAVPTLIEWDNDIPGLDVLLDEATVAERYRHATISQRPHTEVLT